MLVTFIVGLCLCLTTTHAHKYEQMSITNAGERCCTVGQQNYWRESFCEGKREIIKMQSLHLFHLFGFTCFYVAGQKQYDWAFDQEEDQHHHYDHQHHACAQMSMTRTHGVTWPSSERTGSSYQWFLLTGNGLCLHPATPNDLCASLCDRKRICGSAMTDMCRFGVSLDGWSLNEKWPPEAVDHLPAIRHCTKSATSFHVNHIFHMCYFTLKCRHEKIVSLLSIWHNTTKLSCLSFVAELISFPH